MRLYFSELIDGANLGCTNCGRTYIIDSGKVQINPTFSCMIYSFQCQSCGEISNGNQVAADVISLQKKCVWCNGELRSDKLIFCKRCNKDEMQINKTPLP